MTEKRVTVNFDEESYYLDGEYWESWDNYGEEMADAINELLNEESNKREQENEQLKQQLLCDSDSVCDICKHEYLIPKDNYFIPKCRKGHEECSKEDIKYCEDFEVKECKG